MYSIGDFDSGTVLGWANRHSLFEAVSDRTHGDSAYSGYINTVGTSSTVGRIAARSLTPSGQIASIEFYVQETQNGRGEGVRVVNSNGDYELGTAINNPEWDIDDATATEQVYDPANGYDHWVHVTITFDWAATTFDVQFVSESDGESYVATDRPLTQGVDVARIELWSYNNQVWGGSDVEAWFGDIRSSDPRPGRWLLPRTVTSLAEFEGSAPLSSFNGDTGFYGVETSSPLAGSQSIRATARYGQIASETLRTPRGYAYDSLLSLPTGGWGSVVYCVEDPTTAPGGSGYCIRLRQGANDFQIGLQTPNYGFSLLDYTSVPLSPATPYLVRTVIASESIEARLYALDGTPLGTVGPVTDTTHTGGYLGFRSRDTGVLYDSVGRSLLDGDAPTAIIENAERALPLSNYDDPNGILSLSPVAKDGDRAIAFSNTDVSQEAISVGLPEIRAGSSVYWWQNSSDTASGGTGQLGVFLFAVASHDTYGYLQLHYSANTAEAYKQIDGTYTQVGDTLALSERMPPDTYHPCALHWGSGGDCVYEVFTPEGVRVGRIPFSDPAFAAGGRLSRGQIGVRGRANTAGDAVRFDHVVSRQALVPTVTGRAVGRTGPASATIGSASLAATATASTAPTETAVAKTGVSGTATPVASDALDTIDGYAPVSARTLAQADASASATYRALVSGRAVAASSVRERTYPLLSGSVTSGGGFPARTFARGHTTGSSSVTSTASVPVRPTDASAGYDRLATGVLLESTASGSTVPTFDGSGGVQTRASGRTTGQSSVTGHTMLSTRGVTADSGFIALAHGGASVHSAVRGEVGYRRIVDEVSIEGVWDIDRTIRGEVDDDPFS